MTNAVKPGLYHQALGLPSHLLTSLVNHQWQATYSQHAQREALKDRYGRFDLPSLICFSPAQVIEVEVAPGPRVVKILIRQPIDEKRDLVMALQPPTKYERCCFVRTVWINNNDDKHTTLQVERYTRFGVSNN